MKKGLITFNVGGKHFTTNEHTLMFFKDSMLAVMLSSTTESSPSSTIEAVFIDRNPKLFAHILDCYRNRTIYAHSELGLGKRIWEDELAYFQLVKPAVPTAIEKPLVKKKRTAKQMVEKINAEKRAKVAAVADVFEPIIQWMLSKRPAQYFQFIEAPEGMDCPIGLPQEVFDLDPDNLWVHDEEFIKLCNDAGLYVKTSRSNPVGFYVEHEPAKTYYPQTVPVGAGMRICVHIKLLGE